jgi:hypothetical protein
MAQKTCPECDGEGVIEKVLIMNRDAQRAAAVGSYLMITTMRK